MSSYGRTPRSNSSAHHARSMGEQTRVSVGLRGTSLRIGGLGTGVPRQSRSGREHSFDVRPYVSQEPTRKRPSRLSVAPEKERIMCQVEIHEGYNSEGDLGLVIQFSGINFTEPSVFRRSRRYYGPDSSVFYSPVGHDNGQAFLILSTVEDIFESQVVPWTKDRAVPWTKDMDPFFREELYLPPLLTLYDPTSMTPSYNNGLVIVSYKLRQEPSSK